MRNDATKVLVVEDEAIIRMDLVLGLEELGYYVLEANSADAALSLLDAWQDIDLLITDIDMPGKMNGAGLAHEVRRRFPACQIIIMSGHSAPETLDLPKRSAFMPKPISPGELAATFT
ncbi:response regulator [Thioclava sp. JE_KL1]|uniref:response regulator n=1 Tax=Thioclava sp. JE_KL1 TaxID=2651187 RepID=UPI00128D2B85|nr:response regulator [Thioclava sp. JE_KL1]MPQ95799.1 response regulator [Thioclava sp. JE_KL1]